MTEHSIDLGIIDEPVLVFGGPYGNWQATSALLATANKLSIPPERIICTGDTVAYCGDAARTVAAIRHSGIQVVMGNCEESLGAGRDDCGCGFEEGSDCDILSMQWFTHSQEVLGDDDKDWMSRLPRKLTFTMNGRKIAVIHGGAGKMDQFVFNSSPASEKSRDLDTLGVDGIIAGHCGVPFTNIIDGKLWLNAGAIGMPANDGTPRTWYSILAPGSGGIDVQICPLDYDQRSAASSMLDKGIPDTYARTLEDGLWPNMDVLPQVERKQRGQALSAQSMLWA